MKAPPMFKKFSAALAAMAIPVALAATVPTAAQASTLGQEFKAGDRVEQAAIRKGYARYNPLGLCDKQGSRFWCSVSGMRGDCFLEGQAWVSSPRSGYRVRFTNINRECF
jgi:hypothetical protein